MPEKEATIDEKMSKAIGVWAKRNNKRPRDLEDDMGWSYNHAWRILKGVDPFTPAAYGHFILVYGMDAMSELFRIAGVHPAKNGGQDG